MKFYCLHEGFYESVQLRIDQLKAACNQLNIECIVLNSLTVDYSNLPLLGKGDLLYNCARGSETLETLLVNKDVTTFYINNPDFVTFNPDTTKYSMLHDKARIPAPKTIYHLTADRQLLKNYVDYLGGFPLIIKATGSTCGIGTIKIETWQNLVSTVDYLVTTGDKFILRQFIDAKGTARIIVLGKQIIASVFRENHSNDFRVSGSKDQIIDYPKSFDNSIYDMAIKASLIANAEMAGVDILFDKDENPYLLEINFPHDFSTPQRICKTDIALTMIEYLMKKVKQQ